MVTGGSTGRGACAGARIASQGVREVCEALWRRRAALYSEGEVCRLSGLSLERLRAVEGGVVAQ